MGATLEELGTVIDRGEWGTLAPAIGSHQHAMLGAVTATCDLYAFGPDKLLRVYNAKAAGPLRCSRVLLPQLLDESFVRRFPDFWQESPRAQADKVDEAHGGRPLEVPFTVLQVALNERGTILALVGRQRVAVLRLPPSTHADPTSAATAAAATATGGAAEEQGGEVLDLLARLGLGEYEAVFAAKGYGAALRDAHALRGLDAAARQALISDLEMKPGHALALTMHLNGQLPPPPAHAAPVALAAAAALPEEPCFAVPLLPPPPPPPLRSAASRLLASADTPSPHCAAASAFSVPASLLSASRPSGPSVAQLGFHPLSATCLAVLYQDGAFCLYEAAPRVARAPAPTLAMGSRTTLV